MYDLAFILIRNQQRMPHNVPPEILIVRQKYTPYGGAEQFVSRVLDSLVDEGLLVSVLSRKWSEKNSYPAVACNPFYLGRLWRDSGFAKAACQHISQHHGIVQSHERIACCDIYRAGDGVHREWLKQKGTSHGKLANFLNKLSPYHYYVKKAEKRLFTSARLKWVVCNSQMVADELKHWFSLPDEKIRVIYSGVDTTVFHPDLKQHRQEIRQQYRIGSYSDMILFVGSGYGRKGLATAIRAIAKTENMVLVVIGKDSHQWRYKNLAKRLGVTHRVRFIGPQKDVKPFYGAADALVLPTLYDPFPNVILEAMACALPVLTSFKSGAVDIIQSGQNGYLANALDSDTLALQMMALQQDQQLKQKVGEAALNTVSEMTLENMAKNYHNLYKEVLD